MAKLTLVCFTFGYVLALALAKHYGTKNAHIIEKNDVMPRLSRSPRDTVRHGRILDNDDSDTVPCNVRTKCRRSQELEAFEYFNRNCFCDELCETFDDCCKDIQPTSPSQNPLIDTSTVTCSQLNRVASLHDVYIVDKCPTSYRIRPIRNKCEAESVTDILQMIPVMDKDTGILFKNLFCAQCAGFNNVTFWSVFVNCPYRPTGAEGATSMRFLLNSNGGLLDDCYMQFDSAVGLRPARTCKKSIDECSPSWPNNKVKRQCMRYTSYMYTEVSANFTVFRNKHCARCNYVNDTYLSCSDPRGGPSGVMPGPRFAVYSVLINFNDGRNLIRSSPHYDELDFSFTKQNCSAGYVYDHFNSRCVLVHCPPGTIYRLTRCVVDNDQGTDPTDREPEVDHRDAVTEAGSSSRISVTPDISRTDNKDNTTNDVFGFLMCDVITLDHSNFYFLDNGSVHVTTYSRVYHAGDYAFVDQSLYICNPFSKQIANTTAWPSTTSSMMFELDSMESLVLAVGIVLSLMGILVYFIVSLMLPQLRNLPGACIICLALSIFVAQGLFLMGMSQTEIFQVCFILGAVTHYAFLASFFWMNILAFDICRTFSAEVPRYPSKSCCSVRFLCYSMYAWFTPAIIVGASVGFDLFDVVDHYKPRYGHGLCWIMSPRALLVLLALPLAIILLINTILFIITLVHICRSPTSTSHKMNPPRPNTVCISSRMRLVFYIMLSFIIGFTWVFGFLAALVEVPYMWYVFIAFNTLQGIFICFAFCCNKTVFRLLRSKRGLDSANNTNSTSYKPKTYSSCLFDGQPRIVSHETSI